MDSLVASLERSPELFPQSWDPATDTVRLIRMSETDYASASFLDDRILTRETVGRTVTWSQVQAAVAATHLTENCSFIFHIGHVGSTLLSRLLGAHQEVFALREPAVLRTLAQMQEGRATLSNEADFEDRLGIFLRLWSRAFHPGQRACIKTTSFVSELAAKIVTRPSLPRAIFMFVPAEIYLATIFGGPNSRKEAHILAESRLKRLHKRIGAERWKIARLSEGEMIAMSWACEMTVLATAADGRSDQVLWLNFNCFLAEPAASLASAFCHLAVDAEKSEIDRIHSGPDMRRYSKAPEHAYDAQLRRDVLDQARREHAAEITRGLTWLSSASAEFPVVKQWL